MPPFYTYISAGSQPFSFGNALKFDGVNDYVALSGNANGSTVSFWFKLNSGVANYDLMSQYNSSITRWLVFSTNTISIQGKTHVFGSGIIDYSGGWNHLFVYSDENRTLQYAMCNGVLSNAPQTFRPITINQFGVNYLRISYSNITLDEMIFSGNIYTESDGLALYNNGEGAASDTIITRASNYFKFNETSGATTVSNEVVRGVEGTLNKFNTSICWVAH